MILVAAVCVVVELQCWLVFLLLWRLLFTFVVKVTASNLFWVRSTSSGGCSSGSSAGHLLIRRLDVWSLPAPGSSLQFGCISILGQDSETQVALQCTDKSMNGWMMPVVQSTKKANLRTSSFTKTELLNLTRCLPNLQFLNDLTLIKLFLGVMHDSLRCSMVLLHLLRTQY